MDVIIIGAGAFFVFIFLCVAVYAGRCSEEVRKIRVLLEQRLPIPPAHE